MQKSSYKYEVNGDPFSCDVVFPHLYMTESNLNARLSRKPADRMRLVRRGGQSLEVHWVQRTIDRFQIGQRLTAYYNPERPSDAFLLKRPSFGPYFMLMIASVLLLFGLTIAVNQTKGKNGYSDTRSVALQWHGVGLVVFGPYFLLAGRESAMVAVLCAVGYFAIGVACYWDSQWSPLLNLLRRVYLSLVAGVFLGGIAGRLIGSIVAWVAWFAFNRGFGGPVWMIHGATAGAVLSIFALVASALQEKGTPCQS